MPSGQVGFGHQIDIVPASPPGLRSHSISLAQKQQCRPARLMRGSMSSSGGRGGSFILAFRGPLDGIEILIEPLAVRRAVLAALARRAVQSEVSRVAFCS